MSMQNSKNNLIEDFSLVESAQADPNAFEDIFNKYHDAIFNYILRRTCNMNLAEDITANTFMNALSHIRKFKWQNVALAAWLYRIATNEVNLHYRKHKRVVPLDDTMAKELKDDKRTDSDLLKTEAAVQTDQKFKKACRAINKLKINYQTVIALRYFEEKSIKEIADILELPENTIKTRIRRGLMQLREKL